MSVQIKIKPLTKTAVLPSYETGGAAGFDLVADSFKALYTEHKEEPVTETVLETVAKINLHPGQRVLIGTGLAMEIPFGFEVQIRPRSGVSLRKGLIVILGTIDSDYRGEIGIIIVNTSLTPEIISIGDRIAQGVLAECRKAQFSIVYENLSETERGKGGFGSTGEKTKTSQQY